MTITCKRCKKPAIRSDYGQPEYCLPCAKIRNKESDKAHRQKRKEGKPAHE